MNLSRRQFLAQTLAYSSTLSLCGVSPAISLARCKRPGVDYTLVVEEAAVEIIPGVKTQALTYNGVFPAPVLRAKQGVPIRVTVINKLKQATTVHWHGIRLPNAMDGVPFLTQPPIQPGETFTYHFTCPDAGTFWYHPHIHSLEQLSKGLVGVLIVDEAEPVHFDREVILSLKDWFLNDDGTYKPFPPRNAARMGTLGNVHRVNGLAKPVYEIPAGGSVRVRLLNMDITRTYHISLKDQPIQALVLSSDGMPMLPPRPLDVYGIGAGMRIDLGLIAPMQEGQDVIIYDKKGKFHFELCRLRAVSNQQKKVGPIPTLTANPLPPVDLRNAQRLKFVFEWEGALSLTDDKGTKNPTFWMINRRAWRGMDENTTPPPLAQLKRGQTYLMDLRNNSPHTHPIHLHGEIFTVLSSDKRAITPHQADTVLVSRNETVTIALEAENPGRWMFHCHVIEHMITGLMGYITIT